jgi:tape measure domain-containing protein
MQFDNAQFEQGVAKSMKTLDMLNEKLQFKEAQKGLSALMVSVEGVSSKSISTAVKALDRVSDYTTTVLGMMAKKVKEQFADKIVNAIEAIPTRAMSQIKSGGWNRAMNIANAQFQIEGLKFSWDKVREAADYAVTDTAYGLDAAAKAASQLAASGVDFEKIIGKDGAGKDITQMHKSLRAISGVAAMTNSSYDEIAHTFTRIAGQGRVMGEDLNSLASRGLNAAATLAKSLNTTEAEIRSMVSKGQIDFAMFSEAMDEAYGEHAKEANKTFTGALSNMKAALSRIGAIFAQPVIDKTNTLFISLTSRIKEFQKALNDTTGSKLTEKGLEKINKALKKEADNLKLAGSARDAYINSQIEARKRQVLEAEESLKNGDVENYSIARFATHFAEAWESAIGFVSKVVDSLDLSWFTSIGGFLDKAAIKATNFFNAASKAIDKVKVSVDSASQSISDSLKLDINDLDLLHRILQNEFGYVEERWKKLDKIYEQQGSSKTGKWLQGYMDQLAAVGYDFEKLGWTEEEFKKTQEELAKSEAKRVSEMTAEEVAIFNIASALATVRDTMTGVKRTVGNVVKSFGSLVTSALKVLATLRGFEAGLHAEDLAERIAVISDSVLDFVQALAPSEDALYKMQYMAQEVGLVFDSITASISEGAKEVLDFATYCILSEKSLEELAESDGLTSLQTITLSVLRVLKNLWKTVTNISKAIVSVVKPIVKAFKNVFDPSGITSGVADFSEGLATMSEKLIISEEAASVIETVFGGLFTVIQKLIEINAKWIGSITKFISGIGKTKKPLTETTDAVKEIEEKGEKAKGTFENLKTIFENIGKKLKDLPNKIKELKESIDQQEGVIKLKKSFSDLWKNIKEGLSKAIEPLGDGLDEVARTTGGEGQTAIGRFADGVGKAAEKVSNFIDGIPGYITKFEEFFDRIKQKIDDTTKKLKLGDFFKGIGDAFSITASTEGTIVDKVKAFVGQIYEKIQEVVEKVDWKKVSKAGLLGLIMANLFNFLRVTSSIKGVIDSVKKVPLTLVGIFKSIGGLFDQVKVSVKKITDAYVFTALVSAMTALAAAVILLADMPEEKLKMGLAAMTWLALIMLALGKAIEFVGRGLSGMTRQAPKTIHQVDNAKTGVIEMTNNVGGLGIVLAGFGVALYLIMKGVAEVGNVVKGSSDAEIGNILKTLAEILVGLLAFSIILVAFAKLPKWGKKEVDSISGFGIALAGFGVAIWLISKALDTLSGVEIKVQTITTLIGIMSALILFTVALGYAAKGINVKAVAAIGIVLVVLGGIIFGIIGELIFLAGVIAIYEANGTGNAIAESLGAIVSIIITLGVFAFLLGKGAEKLNKANLSALALVIGAMAAVLFAVGIAFKKMLGIVKDSAWNEIVLALSSVILIIAVVSEGISNMIRSLNKQKSFLGSDGAARILALAAVVAAMGVAVLLMAVAADMMQKSIDKNEGLGLVTVMGILVILTVALSALIAAIMGGKLNADGVVDTMMALSIAFLAISVSMLIIAKAAEALDSVDPGALKALCVTMGALMAALILLAMLVGGENNKVGDGLQKVASFFLSMAIAALILSAAVMLLGTGFGALGAGCGVLADGIAHLAEVLAEHKVTAFVAVAIIATVIVLAILLMKNITKVVDVVANAANVVLSAIQTVINKIAGPNGVLQTGSKNLSAWWKDKPSKFKMAAVSALVGISGAIVSATPEMLKNAKELIKKIIYFIIDIIPTLVDALFDILVRIVNALADTVRKNSAQLAYAFWNLIEAITEVILDVAVEGLLLVLGGVKKILNAIGIDTDFIDTWMSGVDEGMGMLKGSMRQGLQYAKDYADSTEIMTQAFSGLDASMNKVTDELAKQNGLTKDAAGNYSKVGTAASAAAGGIAGLVDSSRNFSVSDLVSADKLGDSGAISHITDKLGLGNLGEAAGGEFLGGMGNKLLNADGITGLDMDAEGMMGQMGMGIDDFGDVGEDGAIAYDSSFATEIDSPSAREEVGTASDNLMGVVEDTIADHKKEVEKSVDENINKAIHNTIWGKISERGDDGEYIGNAIIDGLLRAIDDRKSEVTYATTSLGAATFDAFTSKDGIDSNSPSKKFYQGGLYCVQGVANAVNQNQGLATHAMTSLSDQMIDSFGNPLEYAAKMASGEIQYDPTIRPVMDMSSARMGAMNIGSMFRDQSVSLTGLSGQIAYDMTNLNGSNAAVVAEIQALREDMDVMTDELANMQIVMDTGALVGSTVGAYDAALGKRQFYSGRGN